MARQSYKYEFAKKLGSEEEYRLLADDLIEFAQKSSSLSIKTFPLSLMIKPDDFMAFSSHSEYFANAYNTALRIIRARIKQLMHEGTIDRQVALKILPLYDPKFRQYLMERRQKEIAASQTKS